MVLDVKWLTQNDFMTFMLASTAQIIVLILW
jgi:hypothetical protein